ncbi:cupin domain-containing protein [Planococcus shenhongbingii]|uniref:Cupin domain-containing protein n=1 Tax=Planococcus shenhongbingii TaxID=3058398 RepID=A0ABT8N809_9BACL|nr:cupin domain-containing protein [Planococcus sp. N017]MDN7244006.1 cupin domain-containing protein [Planococcus sp. N017]
MDAEYMIKHLGMEPHPEGGFYKRSFESEQLISPETHPDERLFYTSIYFLLRSHDISHLHRLKSDELWYFHAGSALSVHIIDKSGDYRVEKLGLDIKNGEKPQVLVPSGSIFGSSVEKEEAFSLVGCMVAPGFDFADFELFTQDELLAQYPQHEYIIKKMAYDKLPE